MQSALQRSIVSEKQTRSIQRLPEDVQEEVAARVLAGNLAPNTLDAAGRSLRPAKNADDARQILDSLTSQDSNSTRRQQLLRSVTRKTRSARAVLDELIEEGFDQQLTPTARRELERLATQIQQVLR